LDLRGNIPAFILVTDGKYHDSNALDVVVPVSGAIYHLDKAYVDFKALYNIQNCGASFITYASLGLRGDNTIVLNVYKFKKLYPEQLRLVEYYDD
jgi:hypothetical protein